MNETVGHNSSSRDQRSYFNRLTEDGWAVWIGCIFIAILLISNYIVKDYTFKKPLFGWAGREELVNNFFSASNVYLIFGLGCIMAILSFKAVSNGMSLSRYILGFFIIFLLGILSLLIAGNQTINYYGVEYVVFALFFGLIISNFQLAPAWLLRVARSEFYIKTGLVLLGSSVLFNEILKAGVPGILQSIVVVLVVWFFSMWLSRRLRIDDEFGVILASAVSICGVSAAIVASGAIQGDKKKLSYVTTLVLLVAIPMMIIQPWIIRYFHIPELVGGAWLGGTLDTTASVAAATQLVGPLATKVGVIIKFSQNILIGFAAFFIATWWAYTKNTASDMAGRKGWNIIWDRFPKFVLGFIAVSLLFSFVVSATAGSQVSGLINGLRTIWFAMAFVSIGLEAKFKDLFNQSSGRPALVFIGAQAFNIVWTLLWAYLLFGGLLFQVPDIQ